MSLINLFNRPAATSGHVLRTLSGRRRPFLRPIIFLVVLLPVVVTIIYYYNRPKPDSTAVTPQRQEVPVSQQAPAVGQTQTANELYWYAPTPTLWAVGDSALTIKWNYDEALYGHVSEFIVLRWSASDRKYHEVGRTGNSWYTDNGLQNDQQYVYKTQVVTANGISRPSWGYASATPHVLTDAERADWNAYYNGITTAPGESLLKNSDDIIENTVITAEGSKILARDCSETGKPCKEIKLYGLLMQLRHNLATPGDVNLATGQIGTLAIQMREYTEEVKAYRLMIKKVLKYAFWAGICLIVVAFGYSVVRFTR